MTEDTKKKTNSTVGKKSSASVKTGKKSLSKPKIKKSMSPSTKRNISIVIMMFIVAISIYVLVATLSYLMSWSADQSVLQAAKGVKDVASEALKNDAGVAGATIGKVIVSDWFGVFGVMLPISIMILSFFIVYHKKMLLLKMSVSVATGMVIWSTAATFFVPGMMGIYGSSLGGGFGVMMSKLLVNYIGVAGTLLSLLLCLVLWSLYTFPKSLIVFAAIYKAIAYSLVMLFSGRKKNEEQQDDEIGKEQDEDEDEEDEEESESKAATPSEIEQFSQSDEPPFDEDDELVDDKINLKNEKVPFYFNVPTEDERQRAGTHRDDMKKDEFEIVVGANAEVEESGDSTIIQSESDAMDIEEIDQTLFDPTLELSHYKLPPIDLLDDKPIVVKITETEIHENKERILNTLRNFSIEISSIRATVGPTVTLYEIVPATGVRISKIKNLEDDIALSLSALGIRIIAPMPGKGTIGIEVPNKNKEVVSMYSVITSGSFQDSEADLPIVLGRTIQNQNFVLDLAKMPHILVAGATGQGKSVGLNAIITSLLYKKHPSELKFVMVDPKKVELSLYASLEKHYLAKMEEEPDAIITDTQRVISTLNSLCMEMDERYELLKLARVKNIKEYNTKFKNRRLNPLKGHRFMPYIVVIIDEFADLIMTAGKEIETPISRIAQLARAVGIHLVIATQRPSVNVITGVIKANFPARIAFRVMTSIDSKTILDSTGANQLIGRGDMLVSVGGEITRVQCAFVDTPEIERIAEFIGEQTGFGSAMILPEYIPDSEVTHNEESGKASKRDALFDEIARYVVTNQQGSASTIQRNFSIGFNRAGRIMDQLERAGIVGRQVGSKPRDVRITDLSSLELLLYDIDNNRFNVD